MGGSYYENYSEGGPVTVSSYIWDPNYNYTYLGGAFNYGYVELDFSYTPQMSGTFTVAGFNYYMLEDNPWAPDGDSSTTVWGGPPPPYISGCALQGSSWVAGQNLIVCSGQFLTGSSSISGGGPQGSGFLSSSNATVVSDTEIDASVTLTDILYNGAWVDIVDGDDQYMISLPEIDPVISVSAQQSINDGSSGSFSMQAQGDVPTSYAWAFSAPSGAGNNPSVTFASPAAASTLTDGHWFALPNQECGAAQTSTYTITATATFANGPLSANTSLQVNGYWNPSGATPDPSLASTGFTSSFNSQTGLYTITGAGNTTRVTATDQTVTIYVPTNSQFYNKAQQHEHVHVLQQQPGGLEGDMMTVAGFAAAIVGLQDTTMTGLTAKYAAACTAYIQAQNMLLQSAATKNQAEAAAYAVSDMIAPKFLYDNCGRHQ